jgi:pimeloyl-ACP methyl ester carboxylesterase
MAESSVVPFPVPDDRETLRFYDVVSGDGTRLRAWTNDVDGPTVLLCNGLGTSPFAWPALLRDDCRVRVISWNHRGVGGSERPADTSRVGVEAFVEDAVAVLDDAGVDACPAVGWSIGVNTAFELAVKHPDRVTGLFAVAGVPGGTFSSMGAPLQIPRFARRPIALGIASTLRRTGWAFTPVMTRLPVGRRSAFLLSHSGFMMPGADAAVVERAVQEFVTTPVDWYMHLARESARHDRISLSRVQVPAVFVAGTYDILASAHDMQTASERIPGSRFVELRGSHFLQMEHPDEVHQELLAFLAGLRTWGT